MNQYQHEIGTKIDVVELIGQLGRVANNPLTDKRMTVLLAQALIVISVYRDGMDAPDRNVEVPEEYLKCPNLSLQI